jgi:hypothetical protein
MTGILVRTQRQEAAQRRRVIFVVAGTAFILGFLVGFVAGTIQGGAGRKSEPEREAPVSRAAGDTSTARAATEQAAGGTRKPATATPPPDAPVVAWQPSHQDENSPSGYHEYLAMGGVARYASQLTKRYRSVVAWETQSGLEGNNLMPDPTNTPAFDKEIEAANEAGATYFVALQTNTVSVKPGVAVYYQEDDEKSRDLAGFLAERMPTALGLEEVGRIGVRFYSLDAARNRAPYKVMVEFRATGDGVKRFSDRKLQQRAARALVAAMEAFAR